MQLGGNLFHKRFEDDAVVFLCEDRNEHGHNIGLPVQGRIVVLLERCHEHVIQDIRRIFNGFAQLFRTGRVDVFVRILPLRQRNDAYVQAQAADDFHGPERSLAAGSIHIVG